MSRGFAASIAALSISAAACGGGYGSSPAAAAPAGGFVITIAGMSFSPLDLRVPPGATVTVVNRDPEVHSVTSEATPNAFVAGSVAGVSFDTGQFTGTRSFTIPAGAPDGTVVPYFCSSHLAAMNTPTGTITVDAAAQPAAPAPPPPAPGGGY
jgi:plastocyanin